MPNFRFVPFPISLESYFFKSTDTEKALIYYFLKAFHFNNFAKCIGSFSISQIADDIKGNRNSVGKSLKVLEQDGLILCNPDTKNKKIKISFNRKYLNESPEDVQTNLADTCKQNVHDVQTKCASSANKVSSICKKNVHDVQTKCADDKPQTIVKSNSPDTANNSFNNSFKNTYNNSNNKRADVVFSKEKLSKDSEGIYQELIKINDMEEEFARKILLEFPPDFVRQKIAELPYRKILESEGKTLYNSIKGKWEKPFEMVKAEKDLLEAEDKNLESNAWLPVVKIWDKFFNGKSITKENAKQIITHKVKELWKKTDIDLAYSLDFIEKLNKTKQHMDFYEVVNMYPGEVSEMVSLAEEYEVL